jgi:DNA modification methylase
LNLGDSYAGNCSQSSNNGRAGYGNPREKIVSRLFDGIKSKDLIGIPWRVAFALQADGWYLRQDIIWHKPNPMPESVTDRCTKSHEYIFLLSKSQKYYYNNESIKEQASPDTSVRDRDSTKLNNCPGRTKMGGLKVNNYEYRNKRDVWTIPTQPFSEAHFATFPKDLIRPCIRAGCPVNGIVIDPFMGSGTTACVCIEENRNYLGIELNHKYIKIAENRIGSTERAGLIDFGEEE